MDTHQTTKEDRKAAEARAAGIAAVRQGVMTYLAAHGVSQDMAWTVAMEGDLPPMADPAYARVNLNTVVGSIFDLLDDARFVIEAEFGAMSPLEGAVAAMQGIPVIVDDEEVE